MRGLERLSTGALLFGLLMTALIYSPLVALEMREHGDGWVKRAGASYVEFLKSRPDPSDPTGGVNRFALLPVGWGYKWVVCEQTPAGPLYCWKK